MKHQEDRHLVSIASINIPIDMGVPEGQSFRLSYAQACHSRIEAVLFSYLAMLHLSEKSASKSDPDGLDLCVVG